MVFTEEFWVAFSCSPARFPFPFFSFKKQRNTCIYLFVVFMRLVRGSEAGEGDRGPCTSVEEVKLPAAGWLECSFFLSVSFFYQPRWKKQAEHGKTCPPPVPLPWSRKGRPGRELVI